MNSSEAKAPQRDNAAAQPTSAATAKNNDDDTARAQISTFALDVDTASYSYARRTLQDGGRPSPGQVRAEEFVNSFRQDYAQPQADGFTVHVDGARMGADNTAVVRVGLQTRASDAVARRPANLTFVVDNSGSMAEAGRLDLVQNAMHKLLDQLGPGDQVSLVAFSDEARLLASMTPLVSRDELHAAVNEMSIGGGTNLESGLNLGYEQASKAFRAAATNRVIVLSDGLANQGDTQWQSLLEKVKEQAAKQITLLTVGVGRDYGDELMEQLADKADGAAVYISDEAGAAKVFETQLTTTIELRARDAKAQVVFNPKVVASFKLLGYENRAMDAQDFRDDSKDGGEVGPGHSVTALYQVRLKTGATGQLAAASVRWQDPDTREAAEATKSLDTGALSESLWGKGPLRLQVDVVAAAFATALRGEALEGLDLGTLQEHAQRLSGAAEDPMVTELAGLIGKARGME
ncbi:von Willebrand factor type A domain-containing protein [Nonomuraea sp. NBC_01738]|uniref:vWA domain-containing protein n=1 Tax=Nonomuraea sp. NBC_01738 TaxID=2976003 RepID=UPI002E119A79|nr:von Willebrand factor type A domain-containing protein [Nonomuraea sp. NBC_01738]